MNKIISKMEHQKKLTNKEEEYFISDYSIKEIMTPVEKHIIDKEPLLLLNIVLRSGNKNIIEHILKNHKNEIHFDSISQYFSALIGFAKHTNLETFLHFYNQKEIYLNKIGFCSKDEGYRSYFNKGIIHYNSSEVLYSEDKYYKLIDFLNLLLHESFSSENSDITLYLLQDDFLLKGTRNLTGFSHICIKKWALEKDNLFKITRTHPSLPIYFDRTQIMDSDFLILLKEAQGYLQKEQIKKIIINSNSFVNLEKHIKNLEIIDKYLENSKIVTDYFQKYILNDPLFIDANTDMIKKVEHIFIKNIQSKNDLKFFFQDSFNARNIELEELPLLKHKIIKELYCKAHNKFKDDTSIDVFSNLFSLLKNKTESRYFTYNESFFDKIYSFLKINEEVSLSDIDISIQKLNCFSDIINPLIYNYTNNDSLEKTHQAIFENNILFNPINKTAKAQFDKFTGNNLNQCVSLLGRSAFSMSYLMQNTEEGKNIILNKTENHYNILKEIILFCSFIENNNLFNLNAYIKKELSSFLKKSEQFYNFKNIDQIMQKITEDVFSFNQLSTTEQKNNYLNNIIEKISLLHGLGNIDNTIKNKKRL